MLRRLIAIASLLGLALSLSGCLNPCHEPFWHKDKPDACESAPRGS